MDRLLEVGFEVDVLLVLGLELVEAVELVELVEVVGVVDESGADERVAVVGVAVGADVAMLGGADGVRASGAADDVLGATDDSGNDDRSSGLGVAEVRAGTVTPDPPLTPVACGREDAAADDDDGRVAVGSPQAASRTAAIP